MVVGPPLPRKCRTTLLAEQNRQAVRLIRCVVRDDEVRLAVAIQIAHGEAGAACRHIEHRCGAALEDKQLVVRGASYRDDALARCDAVRSSLSDKPHAKTSAARESCSASELEEIFQYYLSAFANAQRSVPLA